MKTAIIIDSSAGIKDTENYKDLFLVPLMITTENGEQISDDENLSHEEFYKMNKQELLKTSQSIPGVMMGMWDKLLKDYDQVVCLLLSKGLSGQFNTFQMLAQEEEYLGKVFCVDTNGVSIVLKKKYLKLLSWEMKKIKVVQKLKQFWIQKMNNLIALSSLNH
ncbi:DegV family protein [Spiroplasma clarkii]|uniref:DegV family protein n=1 Tax=Spiroplasma clarkii TaxID=2139 RepID=UPI0011BAD577|nr:DegV family protein [Spiroplasma clarkii]